MLHMTYVFCYFILYWFSQRNKLKAVRMQMIYSLYNPEDLIFSRLFSQEGQFYNETKLTILTI